jgi:hypothetical protein
MSNLVSFRNACKIPPTAIVDWARLGHWVQNISNQVKVLEVEVSKAGVFLNDTLREGDNWEKILRQVEVLQAMAPLLNKG